MEFSRFGRRAANFSVVRAEIDHTKGIFIRGTEPTKHYLHEELIELARDEMNLEVLDVLKMEYDWKLKWKPTMSPIGWASHIHGIES